MKRAAGTTWADPTWNLGRPVDLPVAGGGGGKGFQGCWLVRVTGQDPPKEQRGLKPRRPSGPAKTWGGV